MKHRLLTAAAAVIGIGVIGFYTFERWPRASEFEILGKPSLVPHERRQGHTFYDGARLIGAAGGNGSVAAALIAPPVPA